MRTKSYWTMLASAALGISVLWNKRNYPDQSWSWVVGKTVLDLGLLAILTAFLPALVLAYSCMFVLDLLNKYTGTDRVLRMTAAVLTGLALTTVAGRFIEILVLIGAAAMDLVTGRLLYLYRSYLPRFQNRSRPSFTQ